MMTALYANSSIKLAALVLFASAVSAFGAGCAAKPAQTSGAAVPASGQSAAVDYYVQGCNAGEADACANAGRVLMDPASSFHDDVLALNVRTRACDGNAYFCGDLGQMYVAGKGVQKDEKKGFAYLDKACTAKNAKACTAEDQAKTASNATTDVANVKKADKPADVTAAKTTTDAPAAKPVADTAAPAVAKKDDGKKPVTKKVTTDSKKKTH